MNKEIKLLIVDDDEVDMLTIKKSLKFSTFQTPDCAERGQTALNLLDKNTYDCIFIDYQLPDMNGIDLLKTIREKGIDTPAIIITSHGDETTAVLAIKSGASDYISKTLLTTDGLALSLRNALKAREIEIERDIAQKELAKAKDAAENSLKIKEQFLANMSHEIRTPMNGIMGITDLLLDTKIDDDQKEKLIAIKKSSENLLIIINDILDFSKIDSDKLTIEETPFDIRALVNTVLTLLGTKASEKNISLRCHIDNNLADSLIGDPLRINQILLNLIGNAIKFTENGKINVNIDIIKQEFGVVFLHIMVIDTGIGIPKEKLESIFESFNQVSPSTTRKYGGSGLGLTISKKLTELMGGTISLESELGKGSKFSIYLALKVNSQHKSAETISEIDVTQIHHFSGIKILVAEDHEVNQLLIKSLLRKWNADFEIVNNGLIASEKLKTNTYDLILADIQMPEMDGYELTEFVRNNIGDKNKLPIIAMTANAFHEEQDRCLEAGMNDYISKPFNAQTLNTKIYNIIETIVKPGKEKLHDVNSVNKNKIINLDLLHQLTEGDKVFEKEMIILFISQIAEDLETLRLAITSTNFLKIKTMVHKLKGSVPLVGLSMLEQPLNEMENLAKGEENIEDINQHFLFLSEICNQAIGELKELLNPS